MITTWQPKRTKFKRLHKGVVQKCQYKSSAVQLRQGVIGLRVLKSGRLTAKQLEQTRRKMITVRKKKEKQKIWFRCIPDVPVTAKPLGIRMGKGKGGIKYWISRLSAGKAIMQMNHMTQRRAIKALLLAKKMLPIPTKVLISKVSRKPATAFN
jgi:large subunit ribosomal protein L16